MTNENIYLNIVDGIITTLRANITDPDTARSGAGKHFIYPDFPRKDASMPRISCTFIPAGDIEELDISGEDELHTQVMQVDVWCSIHGSFSIGGTDYSNMKLCNYLAGQVVKVLKNNRHSLLSSYNITDIMQRRPFGPLASGDEQLVRSMSEYEIVYYQNYT